MSRKIGKTFPKMYHFLTKIQNIPEMKSGTFLISYSDTDYPQKKKKKRTKEVSFHMLSGTGMIAMIL